MWHVKTATHIRGCPGTGSLSSGGRRVTVTLCAQGNRHGVRVQQSQAKLQTQTQFTMYHDLKISYFIYTMYM